MTDSPDQLRQYSSHQTANDPNSIVGQKLAARRREREIKNGDRTRQARMDYISAKENPHSTQRDIDRTKSSYERLKNKKIRY